MPNSTGFHLNQFFGTGLSRNSRRFKEIIELRLILEPEIASLAARNATDKDLARLRTIVDAQAQAVASDSLEPDEDMHFHLALARTTRNDVLLEVVAVLQDLLAESRSVALLSADRAKASVDGHRRIVAALENRDPESARQTMRDHLILVGRELNADFSQGAK